MEGKVCRATRAFRRLIVWQPPLPLLPHRHRRHHLASLLGVIYERSCAAQAVRRRFASVVSVASLGTRLVALCVLPKLAARNVTIVPNSAMHVCL